MPMNFTRSSDAISSQIIASSQEETLSAAAAQPASAFPSTSDPGLRLIRQAFQQVQAPLCDGDLRNHVRLWDKFQRWELAHALLKQFE
jgi:hypothetical protein